MKNLTLFLLTLLTFGLFQTVSAQSLPTKVKSYLKANYPDWKITKGCFSDPKINSKSFVSGDFNGDGKLDYAVAINKDDRDYTLALLATGKTFKAYNLQGIKHDEPGQAMANLGMHRKGEKVNGKGLKTDAIVIADCDAYSEVHYWQNGKFAKVVFQ